MRVENSACYHVGSGLESAVEARDSAYPQCCESTVSEMRAGLNWP